MDQHTLLSMRSPPEGIIIPFGKFSTALFAGIATINTITLIYGIAITLFAKEIDQPNFVSVVVDVHFILKALQVAKLPSIKESDLPF